MTKPRATYAYADKLQYRLKAASTLLGVSDNTLRSYADNAGIPIKRASDITPGAPAARVFDPATLFQLAWWRRTMGYSKAPLPGGRAVRVAIHIVKGGTGKSTTAVELAFHLQLMGLRVVLIDLDVQANASQLMGYESDLTLDEAESYGLSPEAIIVETFANVLLPYLARTRVGHDIQNLTARDIVKKPFGPYGPHLIAADAYFGEVEQALSHAKGPRELYLRQVLDASRRGETPGFNETDYDVVVFDCPPSISFTSTAALAAADIVVSPVRMDAFAVKGLTKVMSELTAIKAAYQLRPELVILPTYYSPHFSRMGRMQTQLNHYKDYLAPGVISASEQFPKSLDNYLPLTLQQPTSTSVKEYRMFAEYLGEKIVANLARSAS